MGGLLKGMATSPRADATASPSNASVLEVLDERWRTSAEIHDRAGRVGAYAKIAHLLCEMAEDGLIESRPNACEWTGAPAYRRMSTEV